MNEKREEKQIKRNLTGPITVLFSFQELREKKLNATSNIMLYLSIYNEYNFKQTQIYFVVETKSMSVLKENIEEK